MQDYTKQPARNQKGIQHTHTPASVPKCSCLHQWKQKNKPAKGGEPHQTAATAEQQLLQEHSSNCPKPAMLKT